MWSALLAGASALAPRHGATTLKAAGAELAGPTYTVLHPSEVTHALGCGNTSTCETPTVLATGNPSAPTVLVFVHTTFDAGWSAMYKLLDGWNPDNLYIVAPDTDGDLTYGPSCSADECCLNTTAGASLLPNGDLPGQCAAGLELKVTRFQRQLQSLVGAGQQLILAGHSMGGSLVEEHVRRGLTPVPNAVVMISNPTNYGGWYVAVFDPSRARSALRARGEG